jgi:hypothetical protein
MSANEVIARELEELKREIQELRARLNEESSQRALADQSLSTQIHMLSARAD